MRGDGKTSTEGRDSRFLFAKCSLASCLHVHSPGPCIQHTGSIPTPSNHGDPIYRHPSAQALKQLSYIKDTRLSGKIETELVPPAASEETAGSPAEKSLNPGSQIALRKRGEPESPRQLLGGQDRQI